MKFISGNYTCFIRANNVTPRRIKVVAVDNNDPDNIFSTIDFDTVTLVNSPVNQIQVEFEGVVDILKKRAKGEAHVAVEIVAPDNIPPYLHFCHKMGEMVFISNMTLLREAYGSPLSQIVRIQMLDDKVTILANKLAKLREDVDKGSKESAEVTSTILDQFGQIKMLVRVNNEQIESEGDSEFDSEYESEDE